MDYTAKNYKFTGDLSQEYVLSVSKYIANKRVLDLGCGDGTYLKTCRKDSVGIDISSKNIDIAKENGHRVIQMDLNNLSDLGENFDVVLSSHVLEHLEFPINYLRYCYRHIVESGLLIISIPNEDALVNLRHPYFTGDGNHLYSFSIDNMKELLSYSGFKVIDIKYDIVSVMTKKLRCSTFLKMLHKLKVPIIDKKIPWAYWIIAKKI